MSKKRSGGHWVYAVMLCGLVGCDSGSSVAQPVGAESTVGSESAVSTGALAPWSEFSATFLEQTFAALPHFAVSKGRHEYDGVQTSYNTAAIQRRRELFRNALDTASVYQFEDPARAYDRDLLRWFAQAALFSLEQSRDYQTNLTSYFGALSADNYVSREYAPLRARYAALVKHTQNIPNLVRQMRENLRTPMPKPHVERGLGYFRGMIDYYESVIPEVFQSIPDAKLHADFEQASLGAVHSFREALVWLQAELLRADDSYRLGPELFTSMLQQVEMLDMSLAEFQQFGEQDLERNLRALGETCGKLVSDMTLAACVRQVTAQKPTAGTVHRAREQLPQLRAFVQAHNLVAIPSADVALVEPAPPHRRANAAYINLRGAYESASVPSTYYVAPPNPAWTEAEQLAYAPGEADLMFISIHEVWPGHFLHGLHLSSGSNKVRQVLTSGGFMEGWAHYAEELMWEAGFGDQNPALHIGQLQNALLRNVRLLCSVGLHTADMTLDACEQLFLTKAFQDPGNARQQAARATYDPQYYSYTLHKLLIRRLRERWEAAAMSKADAAGAVHGERSWAAFHNALLALGAPPTVLAERYLLPQ